MRDRLPDAFQELARKPRASGARGRSGHGLRPGTVRSPAVPRARRARLGRRRRECCAVRPHGEVVFAAELPSELRGSAPPVDHPRDRGQDRQRGDRDDDDHPSCHGCTLRAPVEAGENVFSCQLPEVSRLLDRVARLVLHGRYGGRIASAGAHRPWGQHPMVSVPLPVSTFEKRVAVSKVRSVRNGSGEEGRP